MTDLFLGLFKCIYETVYTRLVSQIIKPVSETDTQFYNVSVPANTLINTSQNELQISTNANSHTWSEYDIDGKITRQLATLTTNLDPADASHNTDGMPEYIYVMQEGVHIAELTSETLSHHLAEFEIFRRTVSPAFIYKDDSEMERIGVITATIQDPDDGTYTGTLDISRWSCVYDVNVSTPTQLTEDESVSLPVSGEIKQLITLNKSATKAAFAIGNKGMLLNDINSVIFAPTFSTIVLIPEESPVYDGYTGSGSGVEDYSISRYTARLALCDGSYDCDNVGTGFKEEKTRTVDESFIETDDQATTESNPGELIAFGYNILVDDFNVLVVRPQYLTKESQYTKDLDYASMGTNITAEDPDEYNDTTTRRKQEYTESSAVTKRIELYTATESDINSNPLLGTTIIEALYLINWSYENILVEEYADTISDDVNEIYDVINESISIIEVIDIATATIQVKKETNRIIDTEQTITTNNYFFDGLNSAQILLKSDAVDRAYNPPSLPYNNGVTENVNRVIEAHVEATIPNTPGCCNWDCRNPASCPDLPSSSTRYKFGDPANYYQTTDTYVETWDLT